MADNERTFAPIASSSRPDARQRSQSRGRSTSRSRSIRAKLGRNQSLHRVYSAQTWDDHYGAYSPPPSPRAERARQVETADSSETQVAIDAEREKIEDRDLEKQETNELSEPESEVQYGIPNERDFRSDGEEEEGGDLEKVRTSRSGRSLRRDPTVVDWDSADDPENPKNWNMKRKWAATFVVSAYTFISPVSSSMIAPALGKVSAEFGITNQVESALVLSIFVLAYAIGPLFLVSKQARTRMCVVLTAGRDHSVKYTDVRKSFSSATCSSLRGTLVADSRKARVR